VSKVKASDVKPGMILAFYAEARQAIYVEAVTPVGDQVVIHSTLNPRDVNDHVSRVVLNLHRSFELTQFETVEEGEEDAIHENPPGEGPG
jgi:hypothetical protein